MLALQLDGRNTKIQVATSQKAKFAAENKRDRASTTLEELKKERVRITQERNQLQERHDKAWEECRQSLRHCGKYNK